MNNHDHETADLEAACNDILGEIHGHRKDLAGLTPGKMADALIAKAEDMRPIELMVLGMSVAADLERADAQFSMALGASITKRLGAARLADGGKES